MVQVLYDSAILDSCVPTWTLLKDMCWGLVGGKMHDTFRNPASMLFLRFEKNSNYRNIELSSFPLLHNIIMLCFLFAHFCIVKCSLGSITKCILNILMTTRKSFKRKKIKIKLMEKFWREFYSIFKIPLKTKFLYIIWIQWVVVFAEYDTYA